MGAYERRDVVVRTRVSDWTSATVCRIVAMRESYWYCSCARSDRSILQTWQVRIDVTAARQSTVQDTKIEIRYGTHLCSYNNQRHMVTSYPTFRIRSASAVGGVAARSCVAFSLRCQSVDIDAVVTRVKYS